MAKKSINELFLEMSNIGLDGWISNEEGEKLRREAELLKPGQTYLEIGVAFGKSLATMAYYAHERVDIWGIDKLDWEQRNQYLEQLGVLGRINFIQGESQQEAIMWKQKPIDLLFIDGDHSYYGVAKDIASWFPLVQHGGKIMFHDYTQTSPGVMRAIHDFIYSHPCYKDFCQDGSIYSFTKI